MPDIVIVSGCAMGIDSIAMRQAMNKGGKVIGVSGAGIESVYPCHQKISMTIVKRIMDYF